MIDIKIIQRINNTFQNFFDENPFISKIPAKDLMQNFIQNGIFDKDRKEGLPIRNLLRSLDKANQLNKIPTVLAERKKINTNWFFIRSELKQNG